MNASGLIADTIVRAEAALRTGNALLCHDLITSATQLGLHPPELAQRLDYLAILSLAHCGSTQRALNRYHAAQRPQAGSDQDWLALEGRLFKDLARQGGAGAQFMYARAAESYWQAFRQTGGYFSAINAATMFLLSGDTARAQALAREVLAQTGDRPGAEELERYNLLVSQAEAALLIDELDVCRQALRSADALARSHRTARARTVQQLQLICQHRRLSKSIPTLLSVPPRLFIHRESEFDAAALPPAPAHANEPLADVEVEFAGATAHVALLEPVDLCAVEQLIERGAHVSVVIPGTRDALSAHWHAQYEAGWTMRLARALDRAGEVQATRGFLAGETRWLRQYAAAKALGLSRQSPEGIRSQWLALRIEPDKGALCLQLRTIDTAQLRSVERGLADRHCPLSEQPRLPGMKERRLCGLLVIRFGSGVLDDAALARLRTRILAPLAQALEPHAAKLLLKRLQGQSVLIATDDPEIAARIALAAQQIHEDRLANADAQTELPQEIRLLAHMAPISRGDDPFETHSGLYGSELAFCEACATQVPPGSVFVTEAFVAALGLVNLGAFRVEYVGESLASAASAGERLFSLRAAG